ncbi:MAG: hypothetical protein IJ852_01780 [Alphaproteobacteria bacterium]|nr:hypothetical protein [Alphaproteobacteria bacterium]
MRTNFLKYKEYISFGGFLICLASLSYTCLDKDYYGSDGAQWMLPPAWSVFGWLMFILMSLFAALWCYDKPRRYKYLAAGFLIGFLWMFESACYILIHMYWFGGR